VNAIQYPIGWLMAIVALAALDFGAIRAAMDHPFGSGLIMVWIVMLPMANILALGLFVGHRYPASRRFILGFETFGVASLAFVVAQCVLGKDWVWSYLTLASDPLSAILRPIGWGNWSTFRRSIMGLLLSSWATWPQVTFALVGGFLCQKAAAAGWPEETHA
jgi:hypothetical protein